MPKAKQLPSGSWRCLAYSHNEIVRDENGKPVIDPKTKKTKTKRIYESFTCDDPSSAGRKKAEFLAAQFALTKTGSSKHNITLSQAMNKYIDSRSATLSPCTIRDYDNTSRNHLQDIMDMSINRITHEQIQDEINNLSLKLSPKTVRNIHGLLVSVFKKYRPDFIFRTSLPAPEKPDLYIPSDDDVKLLLTEAKGTALELPILLAAFGPMRRGEICALYAEDIKKNTVHVVGNMVRYTSRRKIGKNDILMYDDKWLLKRPKSYEGDRFIEYPDYVAKLWAGKSGRLVDMYPNMLTDKFIRFLKKIGLPPFRFHDLRHYSASVQHALGIPDAYIMNRGGWGDDKVLKSVYRHSMDSKQREMNVTANEHFESLSITIPDNLSIAEPPYGPEQYTQLLYGCCGLITEHKIKIPLNNIAYYDELINAIIADYELKDIPDAEERIRNEALSAYAFDNENLFNEWLTSWLLLLKKHCYATRNATRN